MNFHEGNQWASHNRNKLIHIGNAYPVLELMKLITAEGRDAWTMWNGHTPAATSLR